MTQDLRKLTKKNCNIHELRQFIIDIVSVNGGHFGASLGVVELTIASLYLTLQRLLVWTPSIWSQNINRKKDIFHTRNGRV